MFKDLNNLLDQVSAIVREIYSYCNAKKYSSVTIISQIDHQEYVTLSDKLNQALLAIAHSRFILHGKNVQYKEVLEEFLKYVWAFFNKLLMLCMEYKTNEDFLAKLEEIKLS